jgi:hypothetical protein
MKEEITIALFALSVFIGSILVLFVLPLAFILTLLWGIHAIFL